MKFTSYIILLALTCSALLSACGQSGALYLPQQQLPATQNHSHPAPNQQ